MRRRDFLGVCGAAAVAPALPRRARADEANMGLLERYLLIGEEPPWKGSYSQGFYLLENKDAFNNTMTFAATAPAAPTVVQIDVYVAGPGDYTGAGLLVNKLHQSFMGVTLEVGGTLGIYDYKPSDGVTRVRQIQAQGLRNDLVTRLSVQNASDGINILTNGKLCGTLPGNALGKTHGAMATDRGSFYMANFWMG